MIIMAFAVGIEAGYTAERAAATEDIKNSRHHQ